MGVAAVPRGPRERLLPPVGTDRNTGRRSGFPAAMGMGPSGGVRLDRAPPRTSRPRTLATALPRGAASDPVHDRGALGQRSIPLGVAGLFDAAAAAGRRRRAALARDSRRTGLARLLGR